MNTEIFIEGNRLDVSKDISTLLNFSIDDVADFSERSTSWSKTIVLPGTSNNNKLFGHIFEIGQSNFYNPALPNVGYNFNAAKSASCVIFQDQIQTFKGNLRLLEIISENGVLEYEAQAIGELSGLNVALSSGLLEDLDFSEYDHVYDHTNIVASWDNAPGSGYYYPLIDYGNYSDNKHDWDIKTFRPALYAKEYLDKMFADAAFRYSSNLLDTDRLKRLVIPQNKKTLQQISTPGFTGYVPDGVILVGSDLSENLGYLDFSGHGFLNTYPDDGVREITYTPSTPAVMDLNFTATFTMKNTGSGSTINYYFYLYKNGDVLDSKTLSQHGHSTSFVSDFSLSASNVTIEEGDTVVVLFVKGFTDTGTGITDLTASFTGTSNSQVLTEILIGDTVQLNETIPSNIRQIDFLISIVKLFNLYVYEDRFDSKLVHIAPYVDFYTGEVVDWTYKLNRSKPVRSKPMSQLNAKIYEFKYKSDSDFFNDLYKKRYGQDYGNFTYDSQFEFTSNKKSFELIFSGSVLTSVVGEDKVFPSIQKRTTSKTDGILTVTEDQTDSNIRILQTKKITGVSVWSIKDGDTVLSSQTYYGYAGHLDDPDAPANDLNFGAPAELFFTLVYGSLSNNQFNVYWSPYMAEITDKDSKLVTASFYLTPLDIAALDFSKYIFLDGNLFRLNAIKDYNMTEPGDCQVELLKVINSTYSSNLSFGYVDDGYVLGDYVV